MQYLDIFYTDVLGWVKLADMYMELNLCMQVFSVCVVVKYPIPIAVYAAVVYLFIIILSTTEAL